MAGSTIVDNLCGGSYRGWKNNRDSKRKLIKGKYKGCKRNRKSSYKAATDAAILAQAESARNIALFDRQGGAAKTNPRRCKQEYKRTSRGKRKTWRDIRKARERAFKDKRLLVEAGARAELAKNDSIENRAALMLRRRRALKC